MVQDGFYPPLIRFRNKETAFFLIFIIALPLLDNMSGAGVSIGGFSISFVVRIVSLVIFTLYSFYRGAGKTAVLFFLFFILLLPIFLNSIFYYDYLFLKKDFERSVKTAYGIFVTEGLLFLLISKKINSRSIENVAYVSALVYCGVILVSQVLGIGLSAYGDGGSTGFVQAGNDLSLSLALMVPFVYRRTVDTKFSRLIKIFIVFLYAVAMISLFTKSGLLGAGILFLLIFRDLSKGVKIGIFIGSCLAVFFFIQIVVKNSIFLRRLIDIYVLLYEQHGFMGLFFRGRQDIFNHLEKLIGQLSAGQILLGYGFGNFASAYGSLTSYWKVSFKEAEMDPIDLFFSQGAIGLTVIFSYYIYRSKCAFRKTRSGVDLRPSILIFWIHSIFAGHAMSTPIVGTFIAIVLAIGAYDKITANTKVRL